MLNFYAEPTLVAVIIVSTIFAMHIIAIAKMIIQHLATRHQHTYTVVENLDVKRINKVEGTIIISRCSTCGHLKSFRIRI